MEDTKNKTEMLHMQDGDDHLVGIKSLRVILSENDGLWFAQGLEIDYAAAGETLEEVKSNFEYGLEATIREHLKLHGHVENMLIPASQEAWKGFYATATNAMKQELTLLKVHDLSNDNHNSIIGHGFPFKNIAFINTIAA